MAKKILGYVVIFELHEVVQARFFFGKTKEEIHRELQHPDKKILDLISFEEIYGPLDATKRDAYVTMLESQALFEHGRLGIIEMIEILAGQMWQRQR